MVKIWKSEDHLTAPIAMAVARVMVGGCYSDVDVLAAVNATSGLAIVGLQLPITLQELNDTFGPRTPSITTSIPALGVYRFGHKIKGAFRCEYCIFPDGVQRRDAAFEYASNSPPFEGKSILAVPLQPPRATKRASQREAGESGLTPAGKATRSKPTEADLLVTIEERDETIEERDETIAERDETIAERDKTIAERDKTIAERDYGILQLKVRFVKHHHSSTIIISSRGIFSSFSFFKVACCFFLPGAPRCCFAAARVSSRASSRVSSRASSRASSQAAAREHRSLYK
jgi:hypothetical protein